MDGLKSILDIAKESFCKLGIKLKKRHRIQCRKTKMKTENLKKQNEII